MTDDGEVSEIEHMVEELRNYEGRLIDSNYEEYITNGIKKNKTRRGRCFKRKGRKKDWNRLQSKNQGQLPV